MRWSAPSIVFTCPMKRIPEKITCRTGDRRRFPPFGTFFGSFSYRASIRRGRGRGAFASFAGAFSALKPAAPARSLSPSPSPVGRPCGGPGGFVFALVAHVTGGCLSRGQSSGERRGGCGREGGVRSNRGFHPEGVPPQVAQWDDAREFERKRAREKAT